MHALLALLMHFKNKIEKTFAQPFFTHDAALSCAIAYLRLESLRYKHFYLAIHCKFLSVGLTNDK